MVEEPFGRIIEQHGTVVLDGGLATELERRGADLRDPLWSAKVLVEDPDAIRACTPPTSRPAPTSRSPPATRRRSKGSPAGDRPEPGGRAHAPERRARPRSRGLRPRGRRLGGSVRCDARQRGRVHGRLRQGRGPAGRVPRPEDRGAGGGARRARRRDDPLVRRGTCARAREGARDPRLGQLQLSRRPAHLRRHPDRVGRRGGRLGARCRRRRRQLHVAVRRAAGRDDLDTTGKHIVCYPNRGSFWDPMRKTWTDPPRQDARPPLRPLAGRRLARR